MIWVEFVAVWLGFGLLGSILGISSLETDRNTQITPESYWQNIGLWFMSVLGPFNLLCVLIIFI